MTESVAVPAQNPPKKPVLGPELYALFGVVFINLAGFGLVLPLLPFYAQSLKAEAWQVTLMFSAFSAGQFLAEPFWGRLSDRIGRKPVLILTTASNALFYAALAFAPNIWIAIGLRFLAGLGAGNVATIQGYVADVTPPEQRASRMGLIGAAFSLGFIAGPAMGGLLAHPEKGAIGFQLPLFVAAVMAVIASLSVMVFVKESRQFCPHRAASQPNLLQSMTAAKGNAVVTAVMLVTLTYMGAFAGMESTFGLWAKTRYAWGPHHVGLLFGVVGLVAAFTQILLTGRLTRHFGEARTLMIGMVLFGGGLLFQALNHLEQLVPVLVGLAACGQALIFPNTSAMISRSTPPDQQGAMLGLNMAVGSSARIIGPALAGILYTSLGPDMPLIVSAMLCFGAVLLAERAGRTFKRHLTQEDQG